jgi:hypothetical protein
MIIFGWKAREKVIASGEFHCPMCHCLQPYQHLRVSQYFTLYFIPVFPMEKLGEYVKCQHCQGAFKPEVLGLPALPSAQGEWPAAPTKERRRPTSLTVGDRVLAEWPPDKFFYPATVKTVERGRYQILYDDGYWDWADEDRLAELDIEEGDRVFARWRGGSNYYPGVVDQQEGEKVHVCYDHGDQEWTTISMLRVVR